jgi:heat shock protein HslJ
MPDSKPLHRRPERRSPALLIATLALFLAGSLLAGCGQTDNDTKSATAGLPNLEQSLMAHQWQLDASDSTVTAAGPNPVTLIFASATAASGTASCNTYRTGVTLDGDSGIRFDDPVSTLMGCEQALMEADTSYLDALTQVRTADVTDRDRLVLTGNGTRLSFTTFDDSPDTPT